MEKKKVGRPKIEINRVEFEKLCELQCTLEEIASFFDCSEDTIQRWCKREYNENFAVVFDKKRGKGRISLRRAQFNLAKKNATMAIWMGKQYLGQRDTLEVEGKFKLTDDEMKSIEAMFDED